MPTAKKAPDAMKAAQDDAKGASRYGHITFEDVNYDIVRKPNTLLISELARTGTGDPEAMGVFAEFFEVTLGAETYRKFKRATYRSDDEELEATLYGLLQEVLEKTLGRPTE